MKYLAELQLVFFNWKPFVAILLFAGILAIVGCIGWGILWLMDHGGLELALGSGIKGHLMSIGGILLFILFIACTAAMAEPIADLFRLIFSWLD